MEKVFSSSDPGALLHVLMNTAAGSADRVDLSPPEELLQISVIPLAKGRALNPHRAQVRSVRYEGPVQEAWIVMRNEIGVGADELACLAQRLGRHVGRKGGEAHPERAIPR